MSHYLVYHPRREKLTTAGRVVHHDSLSGNQDPYLWNHRFLHSYCHITEMRLEEGDIAIWVSGDRFPNFSALYCDLVFRVQEKLYWKQRNHISPDDPIVDSITAFKDHYRWAFQHRFKRRRRYTLKAHPEESWQPQLMNGALLDILPFLVSRGLSLGTLRHRLKSNRGSRPFKLDALTATAVVAWLEQSSAVRLRGYELEKLRPSPPEDSLSSSKCCTPR